jgi:hypothetical protein
MRHVWRCRCGHETEVAAEETRVGAVHLCEGCGTVWGRVTPRRGGVAWVRISPSDVRFHGLLDEPEDDE